MSDGFLSLRDISQSFDRPDGSTHRVLERCSLDIAAGEFISIVGPSGSGKTTLFNVIAGLAVP